MIVLGLLEEQKCFFGFLIGKTNCKALIIGKVNNGGSFWLKT
jgi:hypothetical protein